MMLEPEEIMDTYNLFQIQTKDIVPFNAKKLMILINYMFVKN